MDTVPLVTLLGTSSLCSQSPSEVGGPFRTSSVSLSSIWSYLKVQRAVPAAQPQASEQARSYVSHQRWPRLSTQHPPNSSSLLWPWSWLKLFTSSCPFELHPPLNGFLHSPSRMKISKGLPFAHSNDSVLPLLPFVAPRDTYLLLEEAR